MKIRYILPVLLCGLVAGSLTSCKDSDKQANASSLQRAMPPVKVSVMNMTCQTVELKSSWFGHLRGVEQADIRPQVSGTLVRQAYLDGSVCEKGDLLFEIDPSTYQAAVDQEKANLAAAEANKLRAEATMDRAQKDVDRYASLVKTGAISEKNYTDSMQTLKETQSALVQAEAGIQQAKAALDNAQINLNRTKVTAPFRGLASKSSASIGELLTASGNPLTTMSSIDPIRVDFAVTGKQVLSKLLDGSIDSKNGTTETIPEFELILENGDTYDKKGKIVSVDSEVSRSTGTINFVGHVPNPDLKLRSGMAIRVRAVTSKEENAFLVPTRAILTAMSHRNIYIVAPDNTPRRIDVKLGESLVLDMPNGKGGTEPMLMQIVTGTQKSIKESLKEIGYDNPTDAPVIVEGSMMAAQYSKANEQMRAKGAQEGFAKVDPSPFIYTKPTSTTPSITAQ